MLDRFRATACTLAVLHLSTVWASAACETDSDCNLNGVCDAQTGTCDCDAAWGGSTCAVLNLLPAVRGQGNCDPSLNGTATGFTTTWGGLPIQDPSGIWHLHNAEMALHCGMCSWATQSQIAHYASDTLTGPYRRVDTAIGPFSTNPVVVEIPAGTAGPGQGYLLMHIGIGCDSAGVHACNYSAMPACENGTTPVHAHPSPQPGPNPPGLHRAHTHVAANLSGPWLPQPSDWTTPVCGNNPAPLFLPNGSLMVMCHEPMASWLSCPGPPSGGLSFATSLSANWTHGPWGFRCVHVTNPNHTIGNATFTLANEDPHLYADARGGLHVLTHNQSPGYQNETWFGGDVRGDGGHLFSADGGETWTFTWFAAYSGLVNFTDGSQRRYKRERPKLVQDPASRRILALSSGVGVELVDSFAAGDDAACTLVVGVAA